MSNYEEELQLRIDTVIANLKSIPSNRKLLFIPLGVDLSMKYSKNNLSRLSQKASLFEICKYAEESIQQDIVKGFEDSNYSWMWLSYEQYSQCRELIDGFFDVRFLKNNLFYNFFPLQQNLDLAELAYTNYGEEVDDEITKNKLDLFNKFYGGVIKTLDNHYFVAYQIELEEKQIIKIFPDILFDGQSEEIDETADHIEVNSEEELLDLSIKIIEGREKNHIQLFSESLDVSYLPNEIPYRLSILKELLPNGTSIAFTVIKDQQKPIVHSLQYHKIMSEYWGYQEFRDLEMYEDIHRGRNIVKISQERIIDSIVTQAEKAINGSSYQDVFVTSPTGAGKSLMFQIPAIYMAEKYPKVRPLTIVISPLISLMQDQVAGMKKKKYNKVGTINSNLSIIQKNKIIDKIQTGDIDILYLSTETLQNHSNIKDLIGERKIGMFIVDEAHIVTTWGKSFRADYWYMGIYLQKLRKEYNFPLVTFTATAIYDGPENMYIDTCNSLNMIRPITYFGKVKRDDTYMEIFDRSREDLKGEDYLSAKFNLILAHLRDFKEKGMKTLIYFPTVKTLQRMYNFLKQYPEIYNQTGVYYGPLDKEEKNQAYRDFRTGDKIFMLATKAFGMGVDIPDIQNVYHYAPTGDVLDYIQEIGRVARDPKIIGYAWVDYFRNDFNEIQRLHGMSAIRKTQILDVMEKIKEIYYSKNTRNLVMNADEFRYLLQNTTSEEDSSIDNRLKIVLLMIEKDFERKYGYSAFYARPKQVFGKELVFGNNEQRNLWSEYHYNRYFSKWDAITKETNYDTIYSIDLTRFWEDHYKDISYPQFKYFVFSKNETNNGLRKQDQDFFRQLNFCSGLKYQLKSNAKQTFADFKNILKVLDEFLMQYQVRCKFFNGDDLSKYFQKVKKYNEIKSKSISDAIVNTLIQYQDTEQIKGIEEKKRGSMIYYRVMPNYNQLLDGLKSNAFNLLFKCKNKGLEESENTTTLYRPRIFTNSKTKGVNSEVVTLGLLESFGFCTYEVVSSDSPQIYIRINSMYSIEKALMNRDKYQNLILNDVTRKHYISVEMFKYLFTIPRRGNGEQEVIINYTRDFWNVIEDYFFGKWPKKVRNAISLMKKTEV